MNCNQTFKSFFLFVIVLCCFSCRDISDKDQMIRPIESEVEVIFPNKDIAVDSSKHTRVVIHSMEGYGKNEAFAKDAAALLENIINSSDFKNAVLANHYEHNNGLTSLQIYQRIMTAHEIVGPGGEDYVVNLRLRTINLKEDGSRWMARCEPNSSAGTIGIDGGGTGIAAVCPQWLESTAKANKKEWLSAHLMHEYMHILDFRHPDKKNKSVPYKIHFIIEKLGNGVKKTTKSI